MTCIRKPIICRASSPSSGSPVSGSRVSGCRISSALIPRSATFGSAISGATISGATMFGAVIFCMLGLISHAFAEPACSATPQTAVARFLGHAGAAVPAGGLPGYGYRVWRTANDPELKRQWMWVAACGGPARPAQLFSVPLQIESRSGKPSYAAAVPQEIVHVGDGVVVIESEKDFSLRLSGIALEAGQQGTKIHVRIPAWHNGQVLAGAVTGKDEVRLESDLHLSAIPQPPLFSDEQAAGESSRDQ